VSHVLRLDAVTKEYPRTGVAVRTVSFAVDKGEFVYLTGPSGSGKSTLLKLLSFAERPSAGEVTVGGYSSASLRQRDIPTLRRRLGIVFQDFRLLADRTVEANVAFALEVTGAPGGTIASKVGRVLTQVGLAAKATAMPHELSGGELQRVAIARALANDPLLLLADEPTGNLDERATRGIVQLLREINALGTAVLMATHDLSLIMRSGYRYLELDRGTLLYDGTDARRLQRHQ
jgi:cell division transport system ATP-binding protein